MEKKVVVLLPDSRCWYSTKVDKDTELSFENKLVKQTLKDLVLTTHKVTHEENKGVYSLNNQKEDEREVESVIDIVREDKIVLKEGDFLILEEEGNGWQKVTEEKFCNIDNAVNEINFLKEQISKIKE